MRGTRLWSALCAAGLCACAGVGAPQVDPESVKQVQAEQGRRMAVAALAVRGRLSNLDLALTRAGTEFCGELTRPKLGAIFGSSGTFSGAAREVAEQSYGLGVEPTVAHVSPGGPLALAEIQPRDRIVSVEGVPVTSMQQVGELLEAHPRELTLTVERGGERLERRVTPVATCPVSLGFAVDEGLLPWKASKLVGGVPLGLLNYLDDDSELAAILGHQLAHLLFDRSSDSVLESELRADRLGLFLAARAGFDVSPAPRAWEKLAAEYPFLALSPRSEYSGHMMLALRMHGIRAAVSEIEQLRREGRALVPGGL